MSVYKLNILDSGRIECEVSIKPYNSPILEVYRFKIDTGADFSTVSKAVLHKLGYTDDWINTNKKLSKGSTSVATGEEIESYYVNLPFISIYGVRGVNYPMSILLDKEEELPKPTCEGCEYTKSRKLDYRCLLGNDILSCFKLLVDREAG